MDPERIKLLDAHLGERRFENARELQDFLRQKALRQKASGRWISLVAILVGVTYLAFQDLITILVISLFIAVGIFFLLRRETREVSAMMLTEEEAAELFTYHNQHQTAE